MTEEIREESPGIIFDGSNSEPRTLPELIGVAIGAGSVCWENPSGAGVFDSDRAQQITAETIGWIQRNYRRRRPFEQDAEGPMVEIGGQVMTQAQYDAARAPLLDGSGRTADVARG